MQKSPKSPRRELERTSAIALLFQLQTEMRNGLPDEERVNTPLSGRDASWGGGTTGEGTLTISSRPPSVKKRLLSACAGRNLGREKKVLIFERGS